MKGFLIQLYTIAGEFISSRRIEADSHESALRTAHMQVGSPEYLKDNDLDLWVIPA